MILVVGEAVSREGCQPFAPIGVSGRRMHKLFGDEARYVNLFDTVLPMAGKGRSFPLEEGRELAIELVFSLRKPTTIIFAGRRVAAAFGFKSARYFEPLRCMDHACFAFPHPSGINRFWNDPNNVARAERCARQIRGGDDRETLDLITAGNRIFADNF